MKRSSTDVFFKALSVVLLVAAVISLMIGKAETAIEYAIATLAIGVFLLMRQDF